MRGRTMKTSRHGPAFMKRQKPQVSSSSSSSPLALSCSSEDGPPAASGAAGASQTVAAAASGASCGCCLAAWREQAGLGCTTARLESLRRQLAQQARLASVVALLATESLQEEALGALSHYEPC